MIGVCLAGSGRMGAIYAREVAARDDMRLVSVLNPNGESAGRLARRHGCAAMTDAAAAIADPAVDALIVASPTPTHLDLIALAAPAGKAILCEKPFDLTLERVDAGLEILERHPVPFLMGFNRRFDPTVSALRAAVRAGAVGRPALLSLTSRDPEPPPMDYVRRSGGYFVDSTIHDIDLACWIADEAPVRVRAAGSCLVEPAIGEAGDVDTAVTILEMPSGCLCQINNSRRSVYGFDQRVEVFGSGGMRQTLNVHEDGLLRWDAEGTMARAPLEAFFLERYASSFARMVEAFAACIRDGAPPSATAAHGRRALAIALACERSRREGVAVAPAY